MLRWHNVGRHDDGQTGGVHQRHTLLTTDRLEEVEQGAENLRGGRGEGGGREGGRREVGGRKGGRMSEEEEGAVGERESETSIGVMYMKDNHQQPVLTWMCVSGRRRSMIMVTSTLSLPSSLE